MKARLESEAGIQEFSTSMPSHEAGLINLVSQITCFAWANGIHKFNRIVIEAEETSVADAMAECQKMLK